jgi:hypothetical protein
MKIYTEPPPPYLMRVNIKKQGEKTHIITLCETTQAEAMEHIKKVIEQQNISPFASGRVTNIEVREAQGQKNGKSISISFKGLEPETVYNLLLNSFNQ